VKLFRLRSLDHQAGATVYEIGKLEILPLNRIAIASKLGLDVIGGLPLLRRASRT
jgi:hypothetical protein